MRGEPPNHGAILNMIDINETRLWKVWADEGPRGDGQMCSICIDDGNSHRCIALVYGKTEDEAREWAQYIVSTMSRVGSEKNGS